MLVQSIKKIWHIWYGFELYESIYIGQEQEIVERSCNEGYLWQIVVVRDIFDGKMYAG